MKDKITRKLFLGFIQLHILRHASQQPVFGSWLIEHLKGHGYAMSPGTLYPLLHRMTKENLLMCEQQTIEGRSRKYYQITDLGGRCWRSSTRRCASCLVTLMTEGL
ncbi:PadR family transcriptional regulator [Dongshaea marina]|uniref:PadR family transcriptional regulator n=1 Tax=Dongshaea marina TaxID=2047966 RepID=UPI00190277B8|nr:PadR family transcriptional regulator [Dongshaea marina]